MAGSPQDSRPGITKRQARAALRAFGAPLSRTAAKRQAHRESHLYRRAPWTPWDVVAPPGEIGPGRGGLTFADARRELAAWRAKRVRELMGEFSMLLAEGDGPASPLPAGSPDLKPCGR